MGLRSPPLPDSTQVRQRRPVRRHDPEGMGDLVLRDVPGTRIAQCKAFVRLPDLGLNPRANGDGYNRNAGRQTSWNHVRRCVNVGLSGNGPQWSVCALRIGDDMGPLDVTELPDELETAPDGCGRRAGVQETAGPQSGLHAQRRLPYLIQSCG